MRFWAPNSVICGLLLLLAASGFAQSADVEAIVTKMIAAQADSKAHLRAYQATRKYQIFKGSEQKSEITAEVSYLPPEQKSFNIVKSTGGTAESVVKRALEHEVAAARTPRDYEISPANYDFSYSGEEVCRDSKCWVLAIAPKRDSKNLVEGRIWVDQSTYLIRRVQGDLAKNPSWWVKKASIDVEYGDVGGMWLQTNSVADAKLRFAGDYRMISRNVGLRSAETVAAARTSSRTSLRRRIANNTVIGESGFFLAQHK